MTMTLAKKPYQLLSIRNPPIFVPYHTHFSFIPLTVKKALSIARLLDTEELYLTTKTLGLI